MDDNAQCSVKTFTHTMKNWQVNFLILINIANIDLTKNSYGHPKRSHL